MLSEALIRGFPSPYFTLRALELKWHLSHPTVAAAFIGHMKIWKSIVESCAANGSAAGECWYYVLEDDARVDHLVQPPGSDLMIIEQVPQVKLVVIIVAVSLAGLQK